MQWAVANFEVTAQAVFPVIADPTWCVITVGDVNGDGVDDLIWFHGETQAVVVWHMRLDVGNLLTIDEARYITGGELPPAPEGFRWRVLVMQHPTLRLLWQLEEVK